MLMRLSTLPPITTILIIVNIGIFAYGTITNLQNQIILDYGFIPNYLFQDSGHSILDGLIRIFTSMFVHASIAHIAFNLFALAFLGGFAERSVGVTRYISLYLISGIAGALLHGIVSFYLLGNGSSVLIGASGAISGVLGITAALGDIRGYYWLVIQVLYVFIGSFASLSIAFVAHVGGFVTGLFLTKLLIEIERKKRKYWTDSNYFI